MLFHVRMDVAIPHDLDRATRDHLVARERARAIELQKAGVWPHLWRITGEYANISIFDVESNQALHDLLTSLPLFPYMHVVVTPLNRDPSKVGD
jgi:muconolactone D-isomerase